MYPKWLVFGLILLSGLFLMVSAAPVADGDAPVKRFKQFQRKSITARDGTPVEAAKREPHPPHPSNWKREPHPPHPSNWKREPHPPHPSNWKREPHPPRPSNWKREPHPPRPSNWKREPHPPRPSNWKREAKA